MWEMSRVTRLSKAEMRAGAVLETRNGLGARGLESLPTDERVAYTTVQTLVYRRVGQRARVPSVILEMKDAESRGVRDRVRAAGGVELVE